MNYSRIFSSLVLIYFLVLCLNNYYFFKMLFIHLLSFISMWEYLRITKLKAIKKKEDQIINNSFLIRIRLNLKEYSLICIFQIILILDNIYFFPVRDILPIIFFLLIIAFLLLPNKYILGLAYIFIPFLFLDSFENKDYVEYLVLIFLISISTDVGAYVFGKLLGGPKIIKTISPNKTWAGFLGGIITTITIVYLLIKNIELDVIVLYFFVAASAVSQVGDVVESAFKRSFYIKDSGTLIPGHGGVLDRLDSFFSITILLIILYYLNFDFSVLFVL